VPAAVARIRRIKLYGNHTSAGSLLPEEKHIRQGITPITVVV